MASTNKIIIYFIKVINVQVQGKTNALNQVDTGDPSKGVKVTMAPPG